MANPIVGIVMGSDSDLPVVDECRKQLAAMDIECEVRVISAHRTPEIAHEYAAGARDRGLKVLVAAAGMSAALAGTLAANTTLPVIGIPVDSGPLVGIDAALATMQMPPGVPVACMAIGKAGAYNAAVLAAQILGVSDAGMADKLAVFKTALVEKTVARDAKLQEKL